MTDHDFLLQKTLQIMMETKALMDGLSDHEKEIHRKIVKGHGGYWNQKLVDDLMELVPKVVPTRLLPYAQSLVWLFWASQVTHRKQQESRFAELVRLGNTDTVFLGSDQKLLDLSEKTLEFCRQAMKEHLRG